MTKIYLLISLMVICACEGGQGDIVPVVETKQGLVSGIKEVSVGGREFFSYMSIPFAEPPVDNLRFKDPVPKRKWEGTLDGSVMPDFCLQFTLIDVISLGSEAENHAGKEDCLFLNVFTAKPNESSSKLPVMVYIHGGGFFSGGAKEYPPYALMNADIVLVVIQYRLGIFGFLSTEDAVLPGNMGLKDQQLALKWVQENIAQFGGDPEAVTIFGESAGGASVHYQILSPGSKGLFQRAILHSGTALCPWASASGHRTHAAQVGKDVDCLLKDQTDSFLECMQGIDPDTLLQLSVKSAVWGIHPIYVLPRVDGEFLPDPPEVLLQEHRYNKVNLIAGKTRDEGALFMIFLELQPKLRRQLLEEFSKYGRHSLNIHEENFEALTSEIYRHYLNKKHLIISPEDEESLVKMFSDRFFGYCHDVAVNFHSTHDHQDAATYLYQLTHEGKTSLLNLVPTFQGRNWISHLDDMFYLFSGGPLFSQPFTDQQDLKLREIMTTLWVNFAKTGNPTPPDSFDFVWERATKGNLRHLNLTPKPKMEKDNFVEERKFWSSLKTKQNDLLRLTLSPDDQSKANDKTEL